MQEADELYNRLILPIEKQMIGIIWRIIRDADEVEDAFEAKLKDPSNSTYSLLYMGLEAPGQKSNPQGRKIRKDYRIQ